MELCEWHGANKKCRLEYLPDALHRTILQVTLEIKLRHWRSLDLPMGSIMSLLRSYERSMLEESSFVNWWNMWVVFGPAERQEMLRRISLVFPDFAYSMLGHWYRHSVCSYMETMD